MKRTMSAVIIASSIALGVGSAHASAATPAQRGCVGASVSAAAQASGAFGQFVSSLAKDPNGFGGPGLGAEVHALQAGQVPDAILPNTCNG